MEKIILVVEDDDNLKETIADILNEASYKVIVASNGQEAIKILLKETPDLIISDVMMPGMDGLELLQYVQSQKDFAHIPFVLLTAKSSRNDFRKGMIAGADDYISKPFQKHELLDAIEVRLIKTQNIQAQLTELRENIALSVPHELRTPLTPILGYASMLMDDTINLTPKEIKNYASTIKSSAIRLHTTVEKFCLYSNLECELNNLQKYSIHFKEKTENIEPLIKLTIDENSNLKKRAEKISMEVEESRLKIDETYFVICIKELIENACKFSNYNTDIKIIGTNLFNYYVLSFLNKGYALTTNQIQKITILNKPFDKTMPGSGLGLPIVKKIIEFFNGSLNIQCLPEKITKVTIQLPIANN